MILILISIFYKNRIIVFVDARKNRHRGFKNVHHLLTQRNDEDVGSSKWGKGGIKEKAIF